MRKKQIIAMALVAALSTSMLTGCGGDSGSGGSIDTSGKSTDFTFLITTAITQNNYSDYDDNPIAQWWAAQEWDADGDGKGVSMNIDYWAPATGSESDYVNTLVSTGEYPDVMPLIYASKSAGAMYEEDMVLDLTDYIEAYMPNYKAYMAAHPEFRYTNHVDGEDKYIQLYILNEDYLSNPWAGLMYRRDWLVKFGTNPQTGEAFTGEWKDGEWTDDVVFPSGGASPVYISDWEWMFGIFETALEMQGMADGYVMQLPYQGMHTTGDIVSGFNTGAILNYDGDGKVVCDAASEGLRAYVECMSNWYSKGWIDEAFAERAGDMFFMIDMASVYTGTVGLWYGMSSQLENGLAGDGTNPWTADAVVYAAATPINDVYGDASVQGHEPALFYQDPLLSSSFVITDKAKDKDIATLLTAIDYFYSPEGSAVFSFGLSDKMMAESEGKPWHDFYVSVGQENGNYTMDGDTVIVDQAIVADNDLAEVTCGKRMLGMSRIKDVDYGYTQTRLANFAQWTKYKSTAGILTDVTGQLASADVTKYNVFFSNANTCIAQWLPAFITGKYDVKDDAQWEQYVSELNALDPDSVVNALNAIIE